VRQLFPRAKVAAIGREAAAAGVIIDLLDKDALVVSHRDLIPAFIKSVPLDKILSHLFACAASSKGAKPRSTLASFSYSPVNLQAPCATVAAQLNAATELAQACKVKNDGSIVVVFTEFEDRSTSLSASNSVVRPTCWLDALDLADSRCLPILFVRQHIVPVEPVSCVRPASRKQKIVTGENTFSTQAFGFPSIPVDGNDLVAVYRVAFESIALMRQGRGPTLIDCQIYRLPDRTPKNGDSARLESSDPILNMENYLTSKGLFSKEFQSRAVAQFTRQLNSAIKAALKKRP
jgi:TPP-dependent pyruvate/acetoin dehydrogenase alpha subunit